MENTTTDIENKIAPEAKTTSKKLKNDYNLMLNYAIKKGIPLPKQITLDNSNLNNLDLIANYNDLITTILPAKLESIIYINTYVFRDSSTNKWFQIPIHKKCVIISFIALVCVVGISLFPSVDNENLAKGLLDSSGKELFLCLLFVCFSALLGVMFYSIKSMNDKLKNYTLTRVDVLELNSLILIGVISGFISSEVISSVFIDATKESVVLTKMTLAILGGFSSDAIFSILQGLVNKIKLLVLK